MSRMERLHRLLGGDALADLRRRLRSRYERGAGAGSMTLTGLSAGERAALAGLLGRPSRQVDSMRVDIDALDAALRHAGLAGNLREALEILDGPITNRTAERVSAQGQWDEVRRHCIEPRLAVLLDDSRGMGLLKRLAASDPGAGMLAADAAQRVLLRLPAQGVARSRLAADTLGDAHALDQGRAAATLTLAALRKSRGNDALESTGLDALAAVPVDESAREIWARAGVLVNELARPALYLNLPATQTIATPGEPCYRSLRELVRTPPQWNVAGRAVFICENPNVVAIAADVLGERSAPLVCTDGMPAAAQRALLTQLVAAGARLHYHGDFDWSGLRIGNLVMREFNAQPWRFGAHDYLAAVAAAADRHPLGAGKVDADWDQSLAAAMHACDRAIEEESVVDVLLQQLAQ
ncbi:MAG: TIGR02679 family protein [Pseudomonadota bacterium]